MRQLIRYGLLLIGVVQGVFALGYIFQMRFAVSLWPLSYTNAMTFIFIGSMLAAAAASTLWCVISKEDGTLMGIAIDYLLIFVPIAIFTLQTAGNSASLRFFGMVCIFASIVGVGMLIWSIRIPMRDQRPMPRPIYVSFWVFIIALVITGGLMVTKTPNILPWDVTIQGQVIYGWFFLGAAGYFAYGVLRPSWHNAAGQLAGFLAYDLVLIVPFLQMLPTIAPERRLGLIFYIVVISTSGILAIFYLFINPATRIWGARLEN